MVQLFQMVLKVIISAVCVCFILEKLVLFMSFKFNDILSKILLCAMLWALMCKPIFLSFPKMTLSFPGTRKDRSIENKDYWVFV